MCTKKNSSVSKNLKKLFQYTKFEFSKHISEKLEKCFPLHKIQNF